MYADDVDFYSLSQTKQRRLVHNKRVATTDQLLNELPKGNPAVRIFERSLDQLVLDQLEQGQYTIEELANHFSVQPADVRRILHKYRRRGSDDFTNENFKLNLLEERHGVIRGVDSDGRSLYYTLQTIPFFARVVDPTLMFSLLGLDEYVDTLPHIAEHIPGGKVTELDEDYAFVIGEYWNIDPEEVFEYLTEFDRAYVDTSLLPLPYIEDDDHYERVSRRFRQVEGVYRMFRGTSDHIQEVGEEFIGRIEQNQAGIATYQVMSIDFADFEWYVDQSGDYVLHNEISDWVEQIARSLHPDEPTKDIDDSTEDTEINLRDEIQLILSEKHRTPAEIYEELPRDIQLGTDKSEVKAVLERLANTGVISKKNEKSTFHYFQRQGKTWE
ncbi:hypothetical protein Harman_37250 [Haloarcula mannanilytica]|uniref:Uncharacterized protein n=1 Tax=Haloarcula mannanilytica TaxID=2509225 RepID=A0A4C2EQQ0_9EURY|nr:hypothetical protein [Haloarcula mannanilytica]GCF15790.1 hypothetical protein Harman_37250 [Haloarcula mannanilytica]